MHLCRSNLTRLYAILHFAFVTLAFGLVAFGVSVSALAQAPVPTATVVDAEAWKQSRLAEIDRELASAGDGASRTEMQARKAWLEEWQPGQMDGLDAFELRRQRLRTEPKLAELRGQVPDRVNAVLERAIALQERLERLDAIDVRKENLHETVAVAEKLVGILQSIPDDALDAKVRDRWKWATAFARYRQARALGYQELPDVVQRQPIRDPEGLDRRLRHVHDDLKSLFDDSQAEFVLLDVRMLRRDEAYGKALQLLERHRSTIDGKWYLKKRRDLLEELGWVPPWNEAAAIYRESGLADE